MRVILVRHCQSDLNAATHPTTWGLTPEGRRQAAALASSPWLRAASVLAAGPEPKMIETLGPTAELLGTDLVVDDALRETDARWLAHDEFVATVARLFAVPTMSPARGWERSCDAGARLLGAIGRQGESSPDGDVVVCSGGRALTSLLVSLAIVTPEQAFAYWQTIGMPDLAVLDLPASGTQAVVRHFAESV